MNSTEVHWLLISLRVVGSESKFDTFCCTLFFCQHYVYTVHHRTWLGSSQIRVDSAYTYELWAYTRAYVIIVYYWCVLRTPHKYSAISHPAIWYVFIKNNYDFTIFVIFDTLKFETILIIFKCMETSTKFDYSQMYGWLHQIHAWY